MTNEAFARVKIDALLAGQGWDLLDTNADSLNSRPRATLNRDTPLQVFKRLLATAHEPAAGVH